MNAELLKAGFILVALAGFVLINVASKQNFKKLGKMIFKPKTEKGNIFMN